MINPVKLEFRIYPSGAWEDWSMYLSEPPSISRKVESDNPGEAGLIVFDNASVSLYYGEGNPVYEAFKEENLYSAQRYMFKISLPKSDKTYEQVFEGMADFSTLEWPEESRLISFEIIDKLSALAMLQSKAPRRLFRLDADINDAIRYDITVLGQSLTLRKTVDGDPATPINPYAPGSIICRNHPSSELNKFYLVKRVVPKTIKVYNDNGTVAGTYDAYEALIFNDLSGYSDPPNTEDRHYYYYLPHYFNIDIGATQTVIVDGNPTEELIAFDAIKLIKALIQQQWSDISLINKTGAATFNIPLSYFEQLIFEQPFNSNPLEALKFLANTMNCYLFINSSGQAVIQSRNNLLGGAERNINSGRLISATKKYFWDKLVDGVNITAKSCIPSSTDNFLQGLSSLTYRLPNSLSSENIIPKNAIDKEVIAASNADTQEELDAYANQVATEYMLFYGKRHDSIEYEIELNDETVQWDLVDHIIIGGEAYFLDKIELNLDGRTLSLEAVKINGADYDLRQVAIALSDKAYTSSGSGSSSYSGGYNSNISPYLWDGSSVVNPGLGRQSLGLNIIANLGDGIIGNTEFNALDGVTSNIQTQLNYKENVLTFTGPLARSGQQISFNYNSTNFKMTGGALNTIQDIHTGAGVQFGSVSAGSADFVDSLNMSSSLFADSARNVYAGRIGVGGEPDFTNYVFKAYGSGYLTGNLLVAGPARVERLGLGTDADASLSLKTAAGAYINGNLTVVGNIYQSGTAYLVDAQHLQVESNIIYVNKNEAGNGVTNGIAGIEVERGTGTNYQFVFQESDDTFRLGVAGSLQAAATRQDSPISQGVAYWNNSVYRFDTSLNLKFDGTHLAIGGAALTEALNVTGNSVFSGLIYQNGSGVNTFAGDISSASYLTGYFGMGFKFWRDASGANGELDNLVIRNSLRTHIFQKDIVRASNGYFFISDSSEIAANTSTSDETKLIYCKENVFQVGDLLWYKDVDDAGGAITGIKITITAVNGEYTLAQSGKKAYRYTYTIFSGSGTFKAGGTIVRYGSNVADRQGSIYFDASSPASPFMDIYDGVAAHTDFQSFDKLVYRAGKLDGITDPALGALSGYGTYTRRGFFTEDVVIGGRSLGLMQGLTALFHFDDNLYDSIGGIKPAYTGTLSETSYGLINSSDNSLVCTKASGKFGRGVAVEKDTTNLLLNGGFETGTNGLSNWAYYGTGTRIYVDGYNGKGYYIETNASGCGLASDGFTATSGATYTIQIKVKGDNLNYWYILRNSGNLAINSYMQKELDGGWRLLTYTTTCSTTETWRILYGYYTGKGIIDEAQVEAKSYATSFVETSRANGVLKFDNDIKAGKSYSFWFKYNGASNTPTWLFHSNNSTSQRLGIVIGSNYAIDVAVNGYYGTGYSLNNINGADLTGQWNLCTIVIDSTNVLFYINDLLIKTQAHSNNFPTYLIYLGNASGDGTQSSVYYDEFIKFDASINSNKIKQLFYSNQPLQESPGMTYINGGKVRTGWISSENYVPGVSGSMWNLNTGYLETNDGWFRGTITASSGLIGGWTIAQKYIDSQYQNDTVNGYLARLTTDLNNSGNNRPGLQFNWGWSNPPSRPSGDISNSLRNSITIGAASYLYTSIGQFAANNWNYDGGGIAVNVDARAIFFAGKRGDVVGGAIANWNFNYFKLWNNNVRLESSYNPQNTEGFTGLAINNGANDRVKIGEFVGTHPDTSINSTLTYMNDPNFNGSLISYATSGYGSTPGAWATRGTITWSITNGALQIYSQSSPPAADTWCAFKNASSLDNKTVLIEFNLTVVANGDAVFTPYVRVDFFDGDVNGNNGADMRRFSQYYQYANPKTYHISKFVTFGTGAYKGLRLYSASGPDFKIVRLDNFTIKEYPDVYTYINGSGLEIYKSPAEHFSFLNGNFNVALEELYINGLLNLNRGFMIGDFKIENEGDKLQLWHKNSAGNYDPIGYITYNRGNNEL